MVVVTMVTAMAMAMVMAMGEAAILWLVGLFAAIWLWRALSSLRARPIL